MVTETQAPMLQVERLRVVASQDAIVRRIGQIKKDDWLGEATPALIAYLDYVHALPWLKEGVQEQDWHQSGDEELRADVRHYLDWWGQKVKGGRGISVHRGREQMVSRLFLAGFEGWKQLAEMDGGWYQEDAYNYVADLFGLPRVKGER